MRLIGMLDSPFVRRVAVTLELLGVPFQHEALSVFSTFAEFQRINPVVKAPTLVLGDGTVLMESSLIIAYVESLAPAQSLWSRDAAERARECRALGLALAACEKSAQLVYEQNLRPGEFQYEPWMNRVTGQLLAAFGELERDVSAHPARYASPRSHATIAAAIAWQFAQSLLAVVVPAAAHPALVLLCARMEREPVFMKYPPDGPGVPAGSVAGRN
jgi:glutathione S-transferase